MTLLHGARGTRGCLLLLMRRTRRHDQLPGASSVLFLFVRQSDRPAAAVTLDVVSRLALMAGMADDLRVVQFQSPIRPDVQGQDVVHGTGRRELLVLH